jgi:hypothetical protein
MSDKLPALAAILKRCEERHAIAAWLNADEITLARQCVEMVIATRAALEEMLKGMDECDNEPR